MEEGTLSDDILHFFFPSGINVKFKIGLHQITNHRFSHNAHADKCYFLHDPSPLETVLIFFCNLALLLINAVGRHISPYA